MLCILELSLTLAFHQYLCDDLLSLRETHRIRILAKIGFDMGRINLYMLWLLFLYAIDAWLVVNSQTSVTNQLKTTTSIRFSPFSLLSKALYSIMVPSGIMTLPR